MRHKCYYYAGCDQWKALCIVNGSLRPSVCPSVFPVDIFIVTCQKAVCDAAGFNFGQTIKRTDTFIIILNNIIIIILIVVIRILQLIGKCK